MFKRQFDYKGYKVSAENYASASEIIAVAQTRKPNPRVGDEGYDFLGYDKAPNSPSWDGFSTQDELFEMARLGIKDHDQIESVQRYAFKARADEKEKYTQKILSVAGGGVNIPLLLSGAPECMYSLKRQKVRTKIIKMGIHCEITAEVKEHDYAAIGRLTGQLISKLEKAGYRLRMHSMDAYWPGGTDIFVLTNVIKRENEPMNYGRILYPLTSVSYTRGLGFGWVARNPDFTGYSLGGYVEEAFDEDTMKQDMDEMFARSTGLEGFVSFTMKDLINLRRSKGDDFTMRYMESRMLESIR